MVPPGRRIFKWVYERVVKPRLCTITSVRTCEPVAAITFDDGPDSDTTPAVMDLLERNGARGTFFVAGENACRHPGVLRQMHAAGHSIGNHSWDHPSLPKIDRRERFKQLRACEKVIEPYSHKLLRPPFGDQSYASRLDACLMGFRVITWNLQSGDWESVSPETTARRLAKCIQPGSILLFHDTLFLTSEKAPTDNYLPIRILELLLRELNGIYQFITVPELLRRGPPHYAYWFQKPTTEFLNRLQGTHGRTARRYQV
jgi:peptidoglycan/xylan/chitin deacetylase (PgdA/CDA1 family)